MPWEAESKHLHSKVNSKEITRSKWWVAATFVVMTENCRDGNCIPLLDEFVHDSERTNWR